MLTSPGLANPMARPGCAVTSCVCMCVCVCGGGGVWVLHTAKAVHSVPAYKPK